jgi:hypothetical protein
MSTLCSLTVGENVVELARLLLFSAKGVTGGMKFT